MKTYVVKHTVWYCESFNLPVETLVRFRWWNPVHWFQEKRVEL